MDGDRELTEWLAEHVMGWKPTGYSTSDQRTHVWAIGRKEFGPTCDLNHARQLEDRLRELGMAEEYAEELTCVVVREKKFPQGMVTLIERYDLLYATARQRCEAVRRTWLSRKDATSGTESIRDV